VRSYTTKPERVCEISLRFQVPNTITTHLHPFKTITRFPFYSRSYSQLPRLIILFLLKKLVGTSILKIELKIMSEVKESSNDPSSPFKEKEKEGEGRSKAWRSMEGEGEGSHAWRPMECSKLGGPWKVKETSFHLFPLSPQPILLKPSIFPFDLKVLLYHGSRPLFTHFLPFLDL
jgi:hypothetical protein